jgi:hypothetical protein
MSAKTQPPVIARYFTADGIKIDIVATMNSMMEHRALFIEPANPKRFGSILKIYPKRNPDGSYCKPHEGNFEVLK